MALLVFSHSLLSAICGAWLRVQILIPLIAIAIVEIVILWHGGITSSVFWSTIVLVSSLEISYLLGSSAAAFLLYSGGEGGFREIARHGHGRFSHF